MTDEEIWDFLVKNEKMAWWFSTRAVGSKKARYFISYLWEYAFKGIKGGGLEKGTIGTVFNYATLTALRAWRCKDDSYAICVPTSLYGSLRKIKKGVDEGQQDINYSADHTMSLDSARTFLVALTWDKAQREEITDFMTNKVTPDLSLVFCEDLDNDWDSHIDIGDLLSFLSQLFTKKVKKRDADLTWRDYRKAKVALYCMARMYSIEVHVMRFAPDIYGLGKEYDLVMPYIEDIKEHAKLVKKSSKDNKTYSPASSATLQSVGDELGITRERVRQVIKHLDSLLPEYIL